MPVTLYGPSIFPVRSLGNARGIVRFQAVAQDRLPHVLFLRGALDEGESDFVRTRGNLDSRRSHALVDLFARYRDVLGAGLVVFLAADRSGKDLLAIDQ